MKVKVDKISSAVRPGETYHLIRFRNILDGIMIGFSKGKWFEWNHQPKYPGPYFRITLFRLSIVVAWMPRWDDEGNHYPWSPRYTEQEN
jgi:hypothetical protein